MSGLSLICLLDDSVSYYKCDITSSSAVSETAAAIRTDVGTPSILINNAGIATAHTILDTSEEFLEKLFRVNLLSHWITIKEFLPAMLDAKKGHIVSIASMASYFSCCGLVDYAATKAGVLTLHEGTSSEIFDVVIYCLLYCKLTSSNPKVSTKNSNTDTARMAAVFRPPSCTPCGLKRLL